MEVCTIHNSLMTCTPRLSHLKFSGHLPQFKFHKNSKEFNSKNLNSTELKVSKLFQLSFVSSGGSRLLSYREGGGGGGRGGEGLLAYKFKFKLKSSLS